MKRLISSMNISYHCLFVVVGVSESNILIYEKKSSLK